MATQIQRTIAGRQNAIKGDETALQGGMRLLAAEQMPQEEAGKHVARTVGDT